MAVTEDINEANRAVLPLRVERLHPPEARLFLGNGREDEVVFRHDTTAAAGDGRVPQSRLARPLPPDW